MTTSVALNVAPGSIVVVRSEEWLVTSVEQDSDGWLGLARGLSELAADITATFYSSLDTIEVLDPRDATGGRGRLPQQTWTVSTQMLADSLGYQWAAVGT